MSTDKESVCDHCLKASNELKSCSVCENVKYCSSSCQKSAWPQHRALCETFHEKEQKDAINLFCNAKIHPFLMAYAYKIKKANPSQIGVCSFTKSDKGYIGSLSTADRDNFKLEGTKESIMVWYKKNSSKGGTRVCIEINCNTEGSAQKYYKEYKKHLIGAKSWLLYYNKGSGEHYVQIMYPDDTTKRLNF